MIIKHNNPASAASQWSGDGDGGGLGKRPGIRLRQCHRTNRPLDAASIQALGNLFVEAFVAPDFTAEP